MKYILVTGAYGGMGKATINYLALNGYYVLALDKKVEEKKNNIIPIECDITDSRMVAKAYEEVLKITDKLFAIIHFAGIYALDSLVEIEEEKYENIFKINVIGPYLVNKNFLPLLDSGSRIIITTSELAVLDPLPFNGIYAITKGALDKYSYSLAMELQLKGIKVSVIRPGAVKTGMLKVSTDELDNFCNKTKLYNISAKNFRDIVNKVEAKYITPEKLAKKAYKVLNKKNPKFNYQINRNKLLIMLDLLPKRWRFKIIKNILNKQK